MTEPDSWPRLASTVIVARRVPSGPPQLLLQRRAKKSAFMGGAYVFPGGAVDPGDTELAAFIDDSSLVSRINAMPGRSLSEAQRRGLLVAALRETLEEAGILMAHHAAEKRQATAEQARDLQESSTDAARLRAFFEQGWRWSTSSLNYWAHWVTPSGEGTRRYDTHFFLAWVPPELEARADGHEVEDELWTTAEQALQRHADGEIYLPPPTEITLRDLGGDDVERLTERSEGRLIQALMPKLELVDGTARVVMPWAPQYADLDGEGWVAQSPASHLPEHISFGGA